MPSAKPPARRLPSTGGGGGGSGAAAAPRSRRPCSLALLLGYCTAALAIFGISTALQRGSRDATPVVPPTAAAAGRGSRAVTPLRVQSIGGQPVGLHPPAQQPPHKFLIFFSGHQGSSALADMLAQLSPVFIPGFEPLDADGLSPAQKLAFLQATFAFPKSPADYPAWRDALAPPGMPGLRMERGALRRWAQLAGKTVSGFKMRPYVLGGGSSSGAAAGGAAAASAAIDAAADGGSSNASGSHGHTAMTGLDPATVRDLLHRHNVSVVLTLRHDTLREALSWHKARDLGVSQFTARAASRAAAGEGAAGQGDGRAPSATPPPPRLRIDIPRLRHWLEYAERVNAELRRAVAYFGRPTLNVWYEDFAADPLAQAAAAAAFIGVPQEHVQGLRLSSKFVKAGPDAIHEWAANYEELCAALEGTSYYASLDAAACAAMRQPLAGGGSSATAGGAAGGSGATRLGAGGAGAPQLHSAWCLPQDKAASGWEGLSDAVCTKRAKAAQVAAAAAAVRNGTGLLLFKHVHKAGGTTLCQLAHLNMRADSSPLPFHKDWDTNCVPYEAFLGPHPALSVGGGGVRAAAEVPAQLPATGSATASRALRAFHLGGACWLGFLTPSQLRGLPQHYAPLQFVASEGPLPDALPLGGTQVAWVTMLRRPLDRVLSSYHWWRFMVTAMPQAPAECHAYSAPRNASLEEWIEAFPDNWVTRELLGRSVLYDWRRRPLALSDLVAAQIRLHAFAAVLLLERPGSSMALMQRAFGWKHVGWDERRAGSKRDSHAEAELPPPLLERLRQRHALDLRLYEYAQTLHAAQAQAWGVDSGTYGGVAAAAGADTKVAVGPWTG